MSSTERDTSLPADVVRDPVRLAAVRSTQLVDHEPLDELDRLTSVARSILRTTAAFLSIVEERRDFYLSQSGFGEPLATDRSLDGTTFCHLAIRSAGPLVIEDTRSEPQYRAIPTVESLGVATYIGVPVRLPGEQILGSFCVIDHEPRRWSTEEVALMVELARSAERLITLRQLARLLPPALHDEQTHTDGTHWHIPRTAGPLPYCMRCQQVASEPQRWEPLVDMLARSGMLVSHRYCPACASVMFGDFSQPAD